MSFRPYSAYRSSGAPWLGDIPVHWQIGRFRHFFSESRDVISDDVFGPMLSVSGYRGIEVKEYDDENRRRRPDELIGYRIVRRGQLVVNTMWLNYAGLGVSAYDGHVSPAYRSYFIDQSLDPRYAHHLLRSSTCVQGYTMFLTGVRPNSLQMSRDDLLGFQIAVPPSSEQVAIADFLDHETTKIDALVAEQERLIALLKEKRQALISHAVTKGLDPNVPMKDSGVEWLGQVPAHWEVGGLTRFIGPVVDYRGRTPTKADDGMFLVTARNVRRGRIDYAVSEEYVDPAEAELLLRRGRPEIGDVLFTMEAPLGEVAIVDRTDIALAQRIVKFRGKPARLGNDFLAYWLMAQPCQEQLQTLATGSTALGIKASKLGMIVCVVPPVAQQQQIVAFLKEQAIRIDALVAQSRHAISLLGERRSVLISAAVTGKIDVRGLA